MLWLAEATGDASPEKVIRARAFVANNLALPVNYVSAVQLLPLELRWLCASCRKHRPSQ